MALLPAKVFTISCFLKMLFCGFHDRGWENLPQIFSEALQTKQIPFTHKNTWVKRSRINYVKHLYSPTYTRSFSPLKSDVINRRPFRSQITPNYNSHKFLTSVKIWFINWDLGLFMNNVIIKRLFRQKSNNYCSETNVFLRENLFQMYSSHLQTKTMKNRTCVGYDRTILDCYLLPSTPPLSHTHTHSLSFSLI